jgi:hypothetical protein
MCRPFYAWEMSRASANRRRTEDLSLADAASRLLDECRMVPPGIQALFGFQLIAVFNARFVELDHREQLLHLVAIGLVALSAAVIMTPAAYHRQTSPERVTETFVQLSTRLVLVSLVPLGIGISLDFYVVAQFIVPTMLAAAAAAVLFVVFMMLWFGLPRFWRP